MRPTTCLLLLLACPSCAAPAGLARTPTCRAAGATRIVAENVYGGEAVAVSRPHGGLDVVLVDQVEPCLHVGFGPGWHNDGTVLGSCPPRPGLVRARSQSGAVTYLTQQFRGTDGQHHVALGYETYDLARAELPSAREARAESVWHRLLPQRLGGATGERTPALATFAEEGFLLVWVEDDTVRAVPLGGGAEPAGPPFELSPPGLDVVGRPSVAISETGEGLVAFTATTPTGTHALATPLTCGP